MGSGPGLNAGSTLKSTFTEANSIGSPGLMTPRTMLAPGGQSVRLTLRGALDAAHRHLEALVGLRRGLRRNPPSGRDQPRTPPANANARFTCDMRALPPKKEPGSRQRQLPGPGSPILKPRA